jgi:starch synthase
VQPIVGNHDDRLKILFVCAEADPFVKVGGLGDVAGELPRALKKLHPGASGGAGLDIRLVIPYHPAIRAKKIETQLVARFDVPYPDQPIAAEVYQTHSDDVPVYLVSGSPIPLEGPVYSGDELIDGRKFIFFSLAVLELCRALDFPPDILHANDWHTAISVYQVEKLRKTDPFFRNTRTIFTIHNLPFVGAGTDKVIKEFGIPFSSNRDLPPWARRLPLPLALESADQLVAVSPGYAREIMTPEFGCGLETLLLHRQETLMGILNGIDPGQWNPSTDQVLAERFDASSLEQRKKNKQALQAEFHLESSGDVPLITLIGRLDRQKGVDLALTSLMKISDTPWQAILLGTGDPILEQTAAELELQLPGKFKAVICFDATLARRLYSGADLLLMPSRYEPCGLAQLIAMRYGCIPLARATGGLADTIVDVLSPEGTGFLFQDPDVDALITCIQRALNFYSNSEDWQAVQKRGMGKDYSWRQSAEDYEKIYLQLKELAL